MEVGLMRGEGVATLAQREGAESVATLGFLGGSSDSAATVLLLLGVPHFSLRGVPAEEPSPLLERNFFPESLSVRNGGLRRSGSAILSVITPRLGSNDCPTSSDSDDS